METGFVECGCQRCGKNVSFKAANLTSENRIIRCPHCGQDTMLFVPAVPPIISKSIIPIFTTDPSKYLGYYKSSDDKNIAGVCAGLAHKMKISKGGLQAAFVLLGVFWIGLLLYIVCWLTFPALPTKNVIIPIAA